MQRKSLEKKLVSDQLLANHSIANHSVANQKIFKAASTTYYYSSLFFTPVVRDAVSTFYAFVRVADDFVDAIPQQKEDFFAFVEEYERQRGSGKGKNVKKAARLVSDKVSKRHREIIQNMIRLQIEYGIEDSVIDAFLNAMAADLSKNIYGSIDETIEYMYGSAEVIGICMAKILGLPAAAQQAAQLQGRAMQYINFIRDISEDLTLNRQYLPTTELKRFGLTNLSQEEALKKPEAFQDFMRAQIALYTQWQSQAAQGYKYIPYRYRVPICTAAQMYAWTARRIAKDPLIVYQKKVKPSKYLVIAIGLWTCFTQLPIVRMFSPT